MPVLDWNSTAAWLGIFATLAISIITPAISTHLNNRFQLQLKEKELLHSEQNALYESKFSVYEGFLQNVGKCLQMHSPDNITRAGTYLYELYLYLPNEHWKLLDSLVNNFDNCLWGEANKNMIELSKILASDLKSSEIITDKTNKKSPKK